MKIDDVKTWRDAEDLLKKQLKKFERFDANSVFVPYKDFATFEKLLWDNFFQTRRTTAKAVLHFLDTGRWPKMQPVERYFCRCRIQFALGRLYFLRGGPRVKSPPAVIQEPAPHATGRFLLHWLLVFIWDHFGGAEWRSTLYGVWEESLQLEQWDTEDREWFRNHYKIQTMMVRETKDRPKNNADCKVYHCTVIFQNGERYAAWIPSSVLPDEELILEAFRKQRVRFFRLNP